jgi:hypothetical protein
VVIGLAWLPGTWLARRAFWLRPAMVGVAGVVWLLLGQGDNLLGPHARPEWGDGDRLFHGYFAYLAEAGGQRFLPDLMGGVDRYGFGRIGGEYWSLRLAALHVMPLWALTVLLRFAVPAVAMLGLYLCARRLVGAPPAVAFALAAFFAVAFDFTATMTFLYGFGLAGLPLLLFTLFAGRWWAIAIVALPFIGSADPIYWLPLLWVMAAALRLWLRPRSDLLMLAALVVISLAWIANYAETLLGFLALLPWSVRGAGAASAGAAGAALAGFAHWLASPVLTHNHAGLFLLLPAGFALLVGLVRGDARTIVAGAMAFATAFAATLLALLPWTAMRLPFLASYRWYWDYGAYALALLAAAQAAALLHRHRKASGADWLAGAAFALALGMLFLFKAEIALQTITRGNLATLSAIPNLVAADWRTDRNVRVVGVPTRIDPNALVNYGFATLDGGATLMHRDLYAFWAQGVTLAGPPPTREFLGFGFNADFLACCDPLEIDRIADLHLLQLANVGYIVSYRALVSPLLTQVSGPAAQTRPAAAAQVLRDPPPAFVYRLAAPMPLAYMARKVEIVGDGADAPALIAALRADRDHRTAVLRAGDAAAMPAVLADAVPAASWAGDRLDIAGLPAEGGVLLVNQAYLPWWRAVDGNGRDLRVVPANLIQMAVAVPPGTTGVSLRYRRPLLADRLGGEARR